MRERFQFFCKCLGTVVITVGLGYIFEGIRVALAPVLFHPVGIAAQLQNIEMEDQFRRKALFECLVVGGAAVLLGAYLTRAGNFFVRLCYPEN